MHQAILNVTLEAIFWIKWSCYCVENVQMQRFSWSTFSRIWTEYGDLRSKSPYLDTFYAVCKKHDFFLPKDLQTSFQ